MPKMPKIDVYYRFYYKVELSQIFATRKTPWRKEKINALAPFEIASITISLIVP